MMLSRTIRMAFASFFWGSFAFAGQGSNPGVTAAPVLQIPIGVRAAGMGSAYTGVAEGISALYFNPAGLSNLETPEFSAGYLRGFDEQVLEHAGVGLPLPFKGLFAGEETSFGASLLLSQSGTIEVTRTNASGGILSSESLSAGSDFVGSIGYSERVGHFEFRSKREGDFEVNHYLGFGGKLIRSTLVERYSASAYAADFGYFLSVPEWSMTAGASVLNVGSRMTYIAEGDPLPLTIRAGIAHDPIQTYGFKLPESQSMILALDAEYLSFEKLWGANIGLEYSFFEKHALRFGYRANQDLLGISFGFGTEWKGFGIDYAWTMTEALSDVHRFGLTLRFGRAGRSSNDEPSPPRETFHKEIEKPAPVRPAPKPPAPRRPPPVRQKAPGWIY